MARPTLRYRAGACQRSRGEAPDVIRAAPAALLAIIGKGEYVQRASNRGLLQLIVTCLCIAASLAAAAPSRADVFSDVQALREGGCGGLLPPAPALHRSALLDHAAREWATGGFEPATAMDRSGYRAQATAALHLNGPESSTLPTLRRTRCATVSDRSLKDIGIYQRGFDSWLLMASSYVVPTSSQVPVLSARVLELVNQARMRGALCGGRSFAPAPPVKLSSLLASVAYGHAADMAAHDYFEHEDREGHTPADRVRAAGYREKLVGENMAYGPQTADEVVKGWMESPGHCQNIMDTRFAEMGVAFALGKGGKRGLYWVQDLAAPDG
jgi:uncharacterized protein YkwD